MTFLESLVGGGCCCVADETAQVEAVVEETSPFFTLKMARVKGLPIGLDVDMLDGVSLIVDRIKDGGFVKSWNEENPDMALQVHDRIIEVNETRFKAQALAAELHHATVWDLKISRPEPVSVSVEHESKATFGVDLFPSRGALLIVKIGDGFLHDWLVANPSASVQQYDRIIQINGVRGNSHKLLRALHASSTSSASKTLAMEVLHYNALPDHFGKIIVPSRGQDGDEKTVRPDEKPSAPDGSQDFNAALLLEQERGQREEL